MYSLYCHIPFCVHHCAYCDFNTYAGQEGLISLYVEALRKEVQAVGDSSTGRMRVHTIFFGGGTPSLLTTSQYEPIFQTIRERFDITPDAEISLEANPGTLSLETLRGYRALGFNRLSLGVQSAHPVELRQLERIHGYLDVVDGVRWARRAGFDNLNLDLIFGLPEQRLERWQKTLQLILGLQPEHLSLYALTVEHGTPFGRWAQRGLLPMPDPDAAADMYEWAQERLANAGYEHYEISNWALPGRQCRHNLQYWRNLPYLGFGAGAHGCAGGVRYSNVLRIKTYIERCFSAAKRPFPLSPAVVAVHHLTLLDEIQETMITGLRLTQEGIPASVFRERFGRDLLEVFGREISESLRSGLLEWEGEVLRLTPRGRLLGNQVFMQFVG